MGFVGDTIELELEDKKEVLFVPITVLPTTR